MKPEITVALPVYNAMPFLPAALERVLNQSLSNVRILAVDDGSTDASGAYLDGVRDPRLTVVHRPNSGLGATLNFALDACETAYFARMDADDLSRPERLALQLAYMHENPSVVMLGTQIEFLVAGRKQSAPPAPLEHAGIERLLLEGRAGVCHPTIVVRTEVARGVGGYRLRGAGEDIDFCLRMCEHGRAANLPQVLHIYRMHLNSLGVSRRDEIRFGYAFAREAARCRRAGMPEPTVEAFQARWSRRSWPRRALERVDDWSGLQYRRARILWGEGARAQATFRFGAAALCRPAATVRHAVNMVRRRLGSTAGEDGT